MGQDNHDGRDHTERVEALEHQLADRASRSARGVVDNLTDALVSGALAGTIKVVRPIAEEIQAQGGNLADLVEDFLAPFRGDGDPRE